MPFDVTQRPLILIVDDDPDITRGIQAVLDDESYETVVADNGVSAKLFLSERKPDLMTLDLNMPGITGLELLDSLHGTEYLEGVKVIVISSGSEEEFVQSIVAGASYVLEKPLNFLDVASKIDDLLH